MSRMATWARNLNEFRGARLKTLKNLLHNTLIYISLMDTTASFPKPKPHSQRQQHFATSVQAEAQRQSTLSRTRSNLQAVPELSSAQWIDTCVDSFPSC